MRENMENIFLRERFKELVGGLVRVDSDLVNILQLIFYGLILFRQIFFYYKIL